MVVASPSPSVMVRLTEPRERRLLIASLMGHSIWERLAGRCSANSRKRLFTVRISMVQGAPPNCVSLLPYPCLESTVIAIPMLAVFGDVGEGAFRTEGLESDSRETFAWKFVVHD